MQRHEKKRRSIRPAKVLAKPIVGVVVDGVMGHGRALIRGVLRYANARRCWLLHEELRGGFSPEFQWPRCTGAIVSGGAAGVFDVVREKTRFIVQCTGGADSSIAPVVSADDQAVGVMAANHLMECRLVHYGFYGRARSRFSLLRQQGFETALAAKKYACAVSPVEWPEVYLWTFRDHWPALQSWLKGLPKPVGILACDDMAAHDLAACCLHAGISVPEQIAIIGVNNDDLLCESSWPPISSVEVDFVHVGFLAAQTMHQLIENRRIPAGSKETLVAPKGVARRMSSDVLAVSEPQLADAIRFIRHHACDPCTVKDVLRQVPVGRRWLERHFLEKVGRTPHDEIIRVRVENALRLLRHPEENIEHVSDICGFSAVPNMVRTFRQVLGYTPAAYRRQHMWGLRNS